MVYQLGFSGTSKFRNFLSALNSQAYDKAADEMLDSKWHRQTPERCERLAKMMREG